MSSSPRKISVNRRVLGGAPPRPQTVVRRSRRDYPSVSRAHLDLAEQLSSPMLMGPPICDELVAFVEHVFSEEEASVACHLGVVRGRSAKDVARAARRPLEEVEGVLKRLAFERFIIVGLGPSGARRYRLMPVVPGIFEMTLVDQHLETLSPWHRRFIELFEALFETGYIQDYDGGSLRSVRFLPVAEAVGGHPAALPSDKLEVVLDRYETFALGQCQCRMAMTYMGKGCGKPMGNCMAMGGWAEAAIKAGRMRQVSRAEALEVKLEAETHGLVSWILNVESSRGQVCCSCCGCCCHGLRMINEFNLPAMAAPPHFLPRFDRSRCTYCGKCARACPMGALMVDTKQKTAWQLPERCIGCGLCSLACDKQKAIAMEPVPDYRLPPDSWFAMIAGGVPGLARTALGVLRRRGLAATWWPG